MNSDSLHCTHCGASTEREAKFCPRCGDSLVPAREIEGRATRLWRFFWQFLLMLGALGFGGVGACSAYVLATGGAKSGDLGDLSQVFWGVGLVAAGFCALCIWILWQRRKR